MSDPEAVNEDGRFASVTPAGCYHAIEGGPPNALRRALVAILGTPETPALETLDADVAAEVRTLVDAGLIRLTIEPERLPPGNLAERLPVLLPALSDGGRVVLTESRQGLFLDYAGVTLEEAEEIAVLASGLRATAERSAALLAGRLDVHSRAFGIVDPAGSSEIGFWPLRIGHNVFTLTILGIPRFNSPQFRLLVWALIERYGQTDADDDGADPVPPSPPSPP